MLSNGIEKNPGPLIHGVDPTKIIQAPYSQGDVHVFGQNAGRQCVAMSLCALIYHNTKGISNSGDLKQIMHTGNQLYSSLSQLARCSYLLLTELPAMLIVAEENFRLEYSASYSGNVHGEATIEGYEYCLGLKRAFESLISQQYRSFILTVGCITVSIVYCVYNGHFKVFDSHARDIYGKSHRQGTCVLLDIPSKDNLIQYFQSLYGIHQMYELKGLQITKYDITTSNNVKDILKNTSLDQHKCLKNNCFAVAFYSICYSIISSCSYWNSKTLDAIIQNGSELNNVIKNDYHSKSINIPENVTIFGMTIKVDVSKVSHGKLTSLPENMISLKTLILKNYGKTGFLMCISSYCIACIYQQNTKEKQLFSLLAYEDSISSTMRHIKLTKTQSSFLTN